MRWLRSFPAVVPPHRAYVMDDMERLLLADYDYSPLAAIDEDVCVLEWDMAASREDRAAFAASAERRRSHILVAPYRLYTVDPTGPVWCHRRVGLDGGEQWIAECEPICDYFGFGLIYLPRELVRAFLVAPAPERGCPPGLGPAQYSDCRMHDQTFSVWHHRSGYGPVMVDWSVRPVHLHE